MLLLLVWMPCVTSMPMTLSAVPAGEEFGEQAPSAAISRLEARTAAGRQLMLT
jgi:hypothetical protein